MTMDSSDRDHPVVYHAQEIEPFREFGHVRGWKEDSIYSVVYIKGAVVPHDHISTHIAVDWTTLEMKQVMYTSCHRLQSIEISVFSRNTIWE